MDQERILMPAMHLRVSFLFIQVNEKKKGFDVASNIKVIIG